MKRQAYQISYWFLGCLGEVLSAFPARLHRCCAGDKQQGGKTKSKPLAVFYESFHSPLLWVLNFPKKQPPAEQKTIW